MVAFSAQDKYDLKELYRIYDFSRVDKVDEEVEKAVAKGQSPKMLFADLYKLHKIKNLPQRESAAKRLHIAVPEADSADIESVLRQCEMKGFSEQDAIRSLERKFGIRHMSSGSIPNIADARRRLSSTAAEEPSELQRVQSNLRRTNADDSGLGGKEKGSLQAVSGGKSSPKAPTADPAKRGVTVPELSASQMTMNEGNASLLGGRSSRLSAAPTRESLDEILAEEVREWMVKILGQKFNEEVVHQPNFIDALRNGVVLNVLLQKMQDPPVADDDIKVPKRVTGFFIRDNVAIFLKEAKARYNLVDAQLFTDSDLCDGKSDRQVVTCLMAMARIAYNCGAIKFAPSIIMYEKEIEEMEKHRMNTCDLNKLIQDAVAEEDNMNEKQNIPEAERQEETIPLVAADVTTKQTEHEEKEATPVKEKSVSPEEEPLISPDTPAHLDAEPSDTAATMSAPAEEEKEANHLFYLRDGMLKPAEPVPEGPPELEDHRKKKNLGPRVVWKHPTSPLSQVQPPRYHSRHWDGIDVALGNQVNEHYQEFPQSPWRFRMVASNAGEYVLYNRQNAQKRIVYIRIIQGKLLFRGSRKNQPWVDFKMAVELLEKEGSK